MTPPMQHAPGLIQPTPQQNDQTQSILALVFGIMSWVIYCGCGACGIVLSIGCAITSIVLSLKVLKKIKLGQENPNNKGMAIAGLATSLSSFLITLLMTLFFALYVVLIIIAAAAENTSTL